MGNTAIIMSEDEAMALPQSKRPMCYRVPSKIYHDVFEAIGAASLSWEPKPTGQFDTTAAEKVAVDLLFKIADEIERLGVTTEKMREKCPEPTSAPSS